MTDLSGKYLGRYYLSERLGEGGMAVVYKAYDTRLERDVAIKIIRSDAFPPSALGEVLKRFEREAKSLAKLSHPNIVKVHDYGEYEGSPYLVMEYLPGGTLKKILGKPIPWRDAVRLILPVARGVAYAHQRGILHRDIKPANVLITESGEPMLSDFGFAKLFGGDQNTALTGSGMAIGTPEYMAPEQWTGTTSPQSDLYSLGIVLYEMATGRKPYMADTPAAILIKQATEPLPNPRKFSEDLPEALEQVLMKALAKEPKDRYKDLTAFIGALENLQVIVPVVLSHAEQRVEATFEVPSPELMILVPTQLPKQDDGETARVADVSMLRKKESMFPSSSRERILPSIKFSRKGIGLLIGGIIIVFAALLNSSPVRNWFSPLLITTSALTPGLAVNQSVTSALFIPTLTLSPTDSPIPEFTQTPTDTPTSTPSPSATISAMTLGEWIFWEDPWCSDPNRNPNISYQHVNIYTLNFKADGAFTRGDLTRIYNDGKTEIIQGSTQGTWTVVGDEITVLHADKYGQYKHEGKLDGNKMKQGEYYNFYNGAWRLSGVCWSAQLK